MTYSKRKAYFQEYNKKRRESERIRLWHFRRDKAEHYRAWCRSYYHKRKAKKCQQQLQQSFP